MDASECACLQSTLRDPTPSSGYSGGGRGGSGTTTRQDYVKAGAGSANAGFILIMALWLVSLLSLILLSITATCRSELLSSRGMLNALEADALADGVTEFAIATRYFGTDDATHTVSGPIICQLENRGIAVIEVENEANKVDINSATEEQLAALFASFGSTSVQAKKAASAVHRFRTATIDGSTIAGYPTDGISEMKGARFDSVMELDQVPLLTREVFAAVIPFVTVEPSLLAPERPEQTTGHPFAVPFSAREGKVVWPEPQPGTMPPVSSATRSEVPGIFLVHVELATTRGVRSTREAIIVGTGSGRRPYVVEWRKGRERYQGFITAANVHGSSGVITKGYPPCWVDN